MVRTVTYPARQTYGLGTRRPRTIHGTRLRIRKLEMILEERGKTARFDPVTNTVRVIHEGATAPGEPLDAQLRELLRERKRATEAVDKARTDLVATMQVDFTPRDRRPFLVFAMIVSLVLDPWEWIRVLVRWMLAWALRMLRQ